MTDETNKNQRTLFVSNLPTGLTEDDIIIHFQSGKNGGGDVEKVVLFPDGCQAFVSFELETVVDDVLAIEQIIKGTPVKVQEKNEEQKDVTTVFVDGFNEETTDETASIFFEHKRKSGGGNIKEFQRLTLKEALITFCSAKDAEDVLNKSSDLCLDGHQLTVKAWKGPPNDKSSLIVENLNPNTTHETLQSYIEVFSKQDVIKIVFGEKNQAIVNLSGDADVECIQKAKKRTLDDSKISIKFAPPTSAVRIRQLPASFSEDAILCKFENEKYGGGEVSDKTFNKEKGEAIIFFKDPSVVSSLVKKKHELSGVELSVTPYYEWFEEVLDGGVKMEEHNGEVPLSRDVMNFIVKHHDVQTMFDLKSFNIDPDKEMLKFSKEFADLNEVKSFDRDFQKFVYSFVKDSITVPKNLTGKLEEVLDENAEDFRNDTCTVKLDQVRQKVILTGEKKEVAAKKEKIAEIIENLREKYTVAKDVIEIEDKNTLQFLKLICYPEQLTTEFPGAEVIVENDSGKITVMANLGIIRDLRNRISRDVMRVTTINLLMNDQQIEFLRLTECKLVNEEFKKVGTSAQLSFVSAKAPGNKEVHLAQIMLLKNSEKENELESVVYKMTSEKCLEVDASTGTFLVLKSATWQDFQDQLFKKSNVKVTHEKTEPTKIWLVGEESTASEAMKEVRKYTTANTITSSTVTINENRARYLTSYLAIEISGINERFSKEGVKVEYSNAGTFKLTGTKTGIAKATEVLQSYSKEVTSEFYELSGPGMKKQLEMENTVALFASIEKENKCIIERNATAEETNEKETISRDGTALLPNDNDFVFVSDKEIRTKSGQTTLSVVVGDLSKEKVDVIVNTTNDKMDLNANPCAESLLEVAGKELEEECKKKGGLKIGEIAVTKAGKLECKHVYHVFCASWAEGKGEPTLRNIVKDCLKKVQDDRLKSIAIPAIGTGNHKFPHSTVANIFFEESLKFLADNPQTTLCDIRFVAYHKDQPSIDAFVNAIKARRPTASATPRKDGRDEEASGNKDIPSAAGPAFLVFETGDGVTLIDDKKIKAKSGQTLSVVVGDLSNQRVDVIVNTTNDKMDLNANPCAKALLEVAGKELEKECKKKGDLKIGEIAITKAGKLDCKHVYHVFCGSWAEGKGEPILIKIVNDCLKKAHDDKLTSIAIPAIGTGNHKFPHSTVANIFFQESLKFLADNPQTTLSDIRFVAYHKDQLSIDGFVNAIKAMRPTVSATLRKDRRDEEARAREDEAKSISRGSVIPSEKREDLSIDYPKFSTFQVNENSDGHVDVFLDKNLTVQIVNGDITKESTEMIMHVTNTNLSLHGGVAKSLLAAGGDTFEKDWKAASPIPLFSAKFTNAGKLSVSQVAHVAAPDKPTFQDLEKCMENFFDSVSKQKVQKISFSAIGAGAIGLSEKDSAKIIFSVLSRFHEIGNSTLSLVRIVIFRKSKFENFKSAVKEPTFRLKSTVSIPKTAGNEKVLNTQLCVRLYGQKSATLEKVWKKLKETLDKQIQTSTLEENLEELSREEVNKIEDVGKSYDVSVHVDVRAGRVEFRGYCGDLTVVYEKVSKMLKKILEHKKKAHPPPDYWTKQPKENGNEVSLHQVKLKSSSSEYKRVAKEFLMTAKTQQIIEIERIQNPPLFGTYIAKKYEKKGINEKYLFHGTKFESVDPIIRHGFNRSYAGINGTAFGRGVYFARDASYSCQEKYSPRDAQGYGYVFYARVLVGQYTKGTEDMIVAPVKKDPNDANAKFDCVVNDVSNPAIFVLFLDREHYPEYLITFK